MTPQYLLFKPLPSRWIQVFLNSCTLSWQTCLAFPNFWLTLPNWIPCQANHSAWINCPGHIMMCPPILHNRGTTMVGNGISAPSVGGIEGGCAPTKTPPTDPLTMMPIFTPWRGRRDDKLQLAIVSTQITTIAQETRGTAMQSFKDLPFRQYLYIVEVGILLLRLGAHPTMSRGAVVAHNPHRGLIRPHTATRGSLRHPGAVPMKITVEVGAAPVPLHGQIDR